jgi:hypothetical protein
MRDLQKLQAAFDAKSPILPQRMGLALRNCQGRGSYCVDVQARENMFDATLYLCDVEDWFKTSNPDPSKGFNHRSWVRYGDVERDAIATIQAQTGETFNALVRRLLREAAQPLESLTESPISGAENLSPLTAEEIDTCVP